MDKAAKTVARRILRIHLLLLLGVVAIVAVSARELYVQAREQTIRQAQAREELLALQTASGIENYYTSILSNLDLMKRTEGDPALILPTVEIDAQARSRIVIRLLWHQLEDRAIRFFSVDTSTLKVVRSLGDVTVETDQKFVDSNRAWFGKLTAGTISDPLKLGNDDVVIVAAPVIQNSRLLAAVLPIHDLDKRFLDPADKFPGLSVGLVDEHANVIAASDETFEPLAKARPGGVLATFVTTHIRSVHSGTEVVNPGTSGTSGFIPSLISTQPIKLPGVHWSLVVRSSLSDIDRILNQFFSRALFWTIFLIASVIGILTSTAVLLIRGNLRVERMQHDLLTREVAQARQIQLAWLPDPKKAAGPFSVAAVNQPASHISGDFYNWFDLPDGRHAIIIGDVTGHGMAAAFLMATTQMLVRAALMRVCDPGHALEVVNRELCIQALRGQFVTLLILVLDAKNNTVDLATAGHPAPLAGNSMDFEPLKIEPEFLLGVEPKVAYRTQRFTLEPGTVLVLYTDGVVEARGAGNKQFTIAGLRDVLRGDDRSPQAVVDRVLAAVQEYSGGKDLADDLTLVAVAFRDIPVVPPDI